MGRAPGPLEHVVVFEELGSKGAGVSVTALCNDKALSQGCGASGS